MNSNEEIFNVYVRTVYKLGTERNSDYKIFFPLYTKRENSEVFNEAPFVMCYNLHQDSDNSVYTDSEFRDYVNDCINTDEDFKEAFMGILHNYFMYGNLD